MISDLVTIAIPAYKSAYLREAIDSALVQDYENIELVIVNDKSPYDIDSIVYSYDDSRIRYYVNENNLGKESIVYNWNRCLDYAQGEFFVLLCDDDVLMPNFVSELLELARKYPLCNVFHSRTKTIYLSGKYEESNEWNEYETFEDYLPAYINGNRKHTITEFLYRTEFIKSIRYIVYPVGFYSDDSTLINLIKQGGVASTKMCLCFFRRSNEHISSSSKFSLEKIRAAVLFYTWLIEEFEDNISVDVMYKIKERIDYEMYTYYKGLNVWKRIKAFFIIPNMFWNMKKKVMNLLLC